MKKKWDSRNQAKPQLFRKLDKIVVEQLGDKKMNKNFFYFLSINIFLLSFQGDWYEQDGRSKKNMQGNV
jgi:hypothetical protein